MSLQDVAQLSFIFTAALTVIGWFIAARQADKREFRKEVRELIRDLRDRLQSIKDSANQYWLNSGSTSADAAVTLKGNILSLSRQIETLVVVGLVIDPTLVAEIRVCATGGDFEKKGRRVNSEDRERLIEISNAVEDLLVAVDREFYRLFPPITDRRRWRWLSLLSFFALGGDRED